MADIVTVPTGDFTPGALAALTYPAEMINAAWGQANTKADDVSTKVTAAEAYIDGAPVANITANVAGTPSVTEPTVTIPSTMGPGDVMTLFDTKYAELVTLLAGKFTDFRTSYFPSEQATYDKAEAWLSSTFDSPLSGLPAGVADQLLEDERTRILNDASRATDAMMATFAARRFPLPPGAATAATLQIQQKAQEEIASSGRKITILSIDMFKFAVEKTLNLRQLAMNAAVDYVKALVSAPEVASRLVGVGYDAQSKLITSAASFFNARTEAARLVSQADQFNVTSKLTADEKNQAVSLSLVEDRLKLMIAELQAIAQMATSLYNNLHASAGTSYGVSVSSSE